MKQLLIILSLFLFSLTNISCTSTSTTNSDNETTTDNKTKTDIETTSDNETTTDNTTTSSGLFVAVGWRVYQPDPFCGTRTSCRKYISKILTSSDNGRVIVKSGV